MKWGLPARGERAFELAVRERLDGDQEEPLRALDGERLRDAVSLELEHEARGAPAEPELLVSRASRAGSRRRLGVEAERARLRPWRRVGDPHEGSAALARATLGTTRTASADEQSADPEHESIRTAVQAPARLHHGAGAERLVLGLPEMRFATVAIVGRANSANRPFLNAALGEALAIVSVRPQTTRDALLGIVHRADAQLAFLDTTGLHTCAQRTRKAHERAALTRRASPTGCFS